MDKFVTIENMEALLPLIKQRFQNIENRLPIFIYKYFEPGVTDTNTGSVIRLNDKYMNQVISIEDDVVITSLTVEMNNEDITKQAYTGPFSAEIFGKVEGEEALYLRQGDSWASGEITPDAGWGIKSISVQMGDDDITSEALSGHEVSVADVRGDIAVEVETACEVVDEPFLSRITANGLTLANTRALLKGIHGNTLVWNQMYPSYAAATSTANGVTFTREGCEITLSGTPEQAGSLGISTWHAPYFIVGHKYYFHLKHINGVNITSGGAGFYSGTADSFIYNCPSTATRYLQFWATSAAVGVAINVTFTVQIIDLTQMFGAGNEPTLAEFEALYPLGDYATDAGRLLDFKGETLRSVGFNLWDEEWEAGVYSNNGQKSTAASAVRCKNPIPVLPNTTYYLAGIEGANRVCYYDKNNTFISTTTGVSTFTTPANCYYMVFNTGTDYGGTYKNDICINLSNTSKNGTYKPYSAQDITINPTAMYGYLNGEGEAVQIFPSGMRSAGSVFDEVYKEDGKWYAKVNVGSVDLGEATWGYSSTVGGFHANGWLVDSKRHAMSVIANQTNTKGYEGAYAYINTMKDKSISINSIYNGGGSVGIKDSSYSTVEAFQDAMVGVMLNYELATPRTYLLTDEWQQILNTAYQVETGGMEIILPENGSEPATSPAKMEIQYGTDGTENN